MDKYSISDDSLAILLPRREELDVGAAVRLMLRLAGLKPWDAVEAELYVLGENMLLLARPAPPRTRRLAGHEPRLHRRS